MREAAMPLEGIQGVGSGPVPLMQPEEQPIQATSSTLARRSVEAGPNPGPRAGFFARLGAIFRSIVHCFSCGEPPGARLHTHSADSPERVATFEAFLVSSSGVFNTMADQYADADDIQSVFARAAEALTGLERTGISRQIALVGVQQLVQGRLDDDLLAIARGFQSQAVAEAQTQMMGLDITVLHPSDEALLQNETAQALLANMEAAVLKELNDRLPRKGVEAQLGAALAGLRSGDSALVGDAVHAAFDSAAPLEEGGAREAARGSRDVDDLVLDKLRELREDELKDLLQHVQPADLTRLKAAARAQAQAHEKEPHKNLLPNSAQLAKAVDQEFASRTAVVVEPFRADAAFFCSRHKNEEHHSLPGDDLKSLVGLARDLEQVKAHCRLYGIDLPQEIWQLKDSPYQPASHLSDLVFLLGGIAAAAFKPPQGVKPEDLEPQMLMDVSNALRSLRLLDPLIGYNLGETLFRAQETRLQERRETLQAMVQEYISSCSSEQESQA